jgi:hypothetical protein
MPNACSETQASDRFGITLDFVTKLHNGSISDEEAKRFLRREDPFRVADDVMVPKPTSWLSIVATTPLGAVKGKPTKKCFVVGKRYYYRDDDFDNWLPASQSNAGACVITTLAPSHNWTFAEAAAAILGIGAGSGIVLLGNALIENGHTVTLPQGEEMVEKTENGVETGMRTDGYGDFCFTETGDPKNPVSVAGVFRDGPRWHALVSRLDYGFRWYAAYRLLVRNLDTSKLGL